MYVGRCVGWCESVNVRWSVRVGWCLVSAGAGGRRTDGGGGGSAT